MKKILKSFLIVMCSFAFVFSCFGMETVAAGSQVPANTNSSTSQYSNDWRYWSQGASKYPVMRTDGCRVVSCAKVLVEMGLASGDVSQFNPDIFYEWCKNNGCFQGSIAEIGVAGSLAIKYAASKGVTLDRTSVPVEGNNNSSDAGKIMNLLNQGYSVILTCTNHTSYINRDDSKNGTPIIYDTWKDWSYNPYVRSNFTSYTLNDFTNAIGFKSESSRRDDPIPPLPPSPAISFNAISSSSITETTAHIEANVTVNRRCYEVGAEYSTNSNMSNAQTVNDSNNPTIRDRIWYDFGNGTYPTLNRSTTYYYRFYYRENASDSRHYSSVLSFTTLGPIPDPVITPDPVQEPAISFNSVSSSAVSGTTAHIEAKVTVRRSCYEVGAEYSTNSNMSNAGTVNDSNNPTIKDRIWYDFGNGRYPALEAGKTYYYRFYYKEKASDSRHYSNVQNFTTPGPVSVLSGKDVFRLYNTRSGEHFYTTNADEKNHLAATGWNYEGRAFIGVDANSGGAVFRLYNPNNFLHHYTMSEAEKNFLVGLGWMYEGVAFHSDGKKSVPVYRQYNPNSGLHNYTASAGEKDYLVSIGWRDEGISWYSDKGL